MVVAAEVAYLVPGDPPDGRFGGHIDMYRRRGDPYASFAITAERWSEAEIAGVTVALAVPVLPDLGLGSSAVVAYVDGWVTVIRADGIELDELLRVAESVLR